jgi:phosphocarrier protein
LIEFSHTVLDELGLHARPAGMLSNTARGFSSKITVTKGGETVDAGRLFALMALQVKKGDVVTFAVEGDDEAEAVAALKEFCGQNL